MRKHFVFSFLICLIVFTITQAEALPPGVEIIAPDPLTVTSGETKQVVIAVRNYNDESESVDIHISSNSELNNWIWFANHRFDSKRHDISIVVQPYDLRRVIIDVLGGNSGTYVTDNIQSNGLNVNALSLSGSAAANISVNIRPVPQGMFKRQAPDISLLYMLVIGLFGSFISVYGAGNRNKN